MVEQICITCGYPSIVAGTVQEAEGKLAQLGHEAFVLIVIDTGILGEGGADLQIEARHLLQAWTGQYPGLPVVFLGTVLQKYAIFAAHAALVPFVTMPFSPNDLMRTVQLLLQEDRQPPPKSAMPPNTTERMLDDDFMHEPPPGALPPCG